MWTKFLQLNSFSYIKYIIKNNLIRISEKAYYLSLKLREAGKIKIKEENVIRIFYTGLTFFLALQSFFFIFNALLCYKNTLIL